VLDLIVFAENKYLVRKAAMLEIPDSLWIIFNVRKQVVFYYWL